MSTNKEIKFQVINNLSLSIDLRMAKYGFTRSANSLIYKRSLKELDQLIDVGVQTHPSDDLNATAVIYPVMEVHVSSVDKVLNEMIGGNLGLLEGVTKGLSNQPVEFTAQKVEKARWFLYQPDDVIGVLGSAVSFLETWAIPFLDEYASASDIVRVDDCNDGRMVADRAHTLRVVAAALTIDRKDYAEHQMEKWLGSKSLRSRYKRIFDYVTGWPNLGAFKAKYGNE